MFNSRVLCSLSIIAVSLIIVSDSDVNVYHANYSCCEPYVILPKEHCEHTVIVKNETIAYINSVRQDCIFPCQKNGDKLEIDYCVDFQVENVCKNGKFTEEEVIVIKALPCQQPQSNQTPPQPQSNQTPPQPQGHVGYLLLALLITKFFFC